MLNAQAKDKVRLKGTIRRILFPRPVNTDTDFIIAILKGSGEMEVTIKGAMCGIHEKDEILIEGEWVNDKKYGLQVLVTGWERPIPTTKTQAIDLLSSSMIKGCGPKTAKLIVEALGDGAIETILQQKEASLYSIKGINKNNAAKIVGSLSDNFNVQNIIKHLSRYGVTVKMAIKLHKVYGGNAVPIVKANPYELANLSMVGFDKGDTIALNMGITEDDPFRCQAAVLHIMRKYDGHCYTEKYELMRDSLSMLNKRSKTILRETDVESALHYLHKAQKVVIDNNRIYLKAIYEYERTAARKIAELIATKGPVMPKARIAHEITKYQTKNQIILNTKQQEVIYQLFESNILILTGGPGTGKCVSRGTLVLTGHGIIPIEDLAPTPDSLEDTFETLDITIQGRRIKTETSHFYHGGVKKTIKVKTRTGFEIEGTLNHRILCMTKNGPDWKRLDQITAIDYIAIHRGSNLWGRDAADQKDIEIAYLLGLFIGDGSRIGRTGLTLSNPEEEILYWVQHVLKLYYDYEAKTHYSDGRCPYIRVFRQDIVNDLISRGYCQRAVSADKIVSDSIMQGSRPEVIAFIQGLFDTDGHSSIRDGYIEWTTKSPKLANQVQILLANLGIIANQRIKTIIYQKEPRNFVCTTITGDEARLFYEKVGFRLKRKQFNRCKLSSKPNTNLDVVPLMEKEIRTFLKKTGPHSRKFWWKWKRECRGLRNPSRERLLELFALFKDTATANESLLEACNPNLFWDQVDVISHGKSEVYDLTVPSEESFVANGFVNHNTAVIKAASYIYQQLFPAVSKALCAPTGRASQHLAKTSGIKAKTVHRLLNWGVKAKDAEDAPLKAKKDELNPLSEELVIPDEWSMADIELASSFLRSIPSKGKVLFVGDPDQLPSVGPGAVLRDMINSQVVPVVHLDEIYRQAKNSLITENAYRVKRGKMIQTDPKRKDFIFIERPDAESVQKTILASVKRLLEIGYKIEDILVLSPIKKGTAGVIALDEAVKALVNPANRLKKELSIRNKSFRVGDIIIQNQKNYVDKELYNGNMGVVKDICPDPTDKGNKEEGLLCDIWGNEVFLSRDDITEFDFTTGYCITTDKSQGGQAKAVIMPVITNHYIRLTRNILFTAMTRAEEMMVLVGQKKAVAMAIANTTPNLRRTFLSERIRMMVDEKKKGASNMALFG